MPSFHSGVTYAAVMSPSTRNVDPLTVAQKLAIPVQLATLSGFGSDASIAMKFGHVARAACLAFPTQNTHGYEIAHLEVITNCIQLLQAFCETEFD